MWNPLNFAVYNGQLDVIRLLTETFKINMARTAPRHQASNEGDMVNDQERYIEDTVFLLQMALVRQKHDILNYLLNEHSDFWPKNILKDWFVP